MLIKVTNLLYLGPTTNCLWISSQPKNNSSDYCRLASTIWTHNYVQIATWFQLNETVSTNQNNAITLLNLEFCIGSILLINNLFCEIYEFLSHKQKFREKTEEENGMQYFFISLDNVRVPTMLDLTTFTEL